MPAQRTQATDRSQILALVDCGRITVTEAECMLASSMLDASNFAGVGARIRSRGKSFIESRPVISLAVALGAGIALQPSLVAGWHALMHAIDAPGSLQFFFNRLLEAFL
jgi:hypothetical protein